jgi:hypothetical protein
MVRIDFFINLNLFELKKHKIKLCKKKGNLLEGIL